MSIGIFFESYISKTLEIFGFLKVIPFGFKDHLIKYIIYLHNKVLYNPINIETLFKGQGILRPSIKKVILNLKNDLEEI